MQIFNYFVILFQAFCEEHTKEEIEKILCDVAKHSPFLFRSLVNREVRDDTNQPLSLPPSWCKCDHCNEERLPEDRICCKNNPKNHENPVFKQLCLDEETLEVALINNCDWLNMPKIYSPAKFRNTAYRQYILWFYGRLDFRNRRIPSCIKWKIRERYPEPDGNYVGFMEAI